MIVETVLALTAIVESLEEWEWADVALAQRLVVAPAVTAALAVRESWLADLVVLAELATAVEWSADNVDADWATTLLIPEDSQDLTDRKQPTTGTHTTPLGHPETF